MGFPTAAAGASPEAAAAAAAHAVLLAVFPGDRGLLDDALTVGLGRVVDARARQAGRTVGADAARAVLRSGERKARADRKPYLPRTLPGLWIGTTAPMLIDLSLEPWVLPRAEALRPAGPPALTEARWARDFEEVKRVGARESQQRTPEQTVLARFWISAALGPTVRPIADLPGRSLVQNARLFALVHLALDDTTLAIAEAKMHFNFWRPITAIRNGENDGNPATTAVPGWEPLLATPHHPEYPCGHCARAATLATVLSAEAGPRPPGGVRAVNHQMPGVEVVLPSFEDYTRAVADSRMLGGVHFRSSNDDGVALGRAVAGRILEAALGPLPAERPRAAAGKSP